LTIPQMSKLTISLQFYITTVTNLYYISINSLKIVYREINVTRGLHSEYENTNKEEK